MPEAEEAAQEVAEDAPEADDVDFEDLDPKTQKYVKNHRAEAQKFRAENKRFEKFHDLNDEQLGHLNDLAEAVGNGDLQATFDWVYGTAKDLAQDQWETIVRNDFTEPQEAPVAEETDGTESITTTRAELDDIVASAVAAKLDEKLDDRMGQFEQKSTQERNRDAALSVAATLGYEQNVDDPHTRGLLYRAGAPDAPTESLQERIKWAHDKLREEWLARFSDEEAEETPGETPPPPPTGQAPSGTEPESATGKGRMKSRLDDLGWTR